MELHSHLNPSADDGLGNLPQDLEQDNPLGVRVYFWDKYQDNPAKLCWEGSVIPHILHQCHQFLPAGQIGAATPRGVRYGGVCVSSGFVPLQLAYFCLHLRLSRNPIICQEGSDVKCQWSSQGEWRLKLVQRSVVAGDLLGVCS